MLTVLVPLVGVAAILCSIIYILNCLCWRHTAGFKGFEDSLEHGSPTGTYLTNEQMYSPPAHNTDDSENSGHQSRVSFDPLPSVDEVISKKSSRASLGLDQQKRSSLAAIPDNRRISGLSVTSLVSSGLDFPRTQIQFIKEIGQGWFGQVLQGEAQKITVGLRKSKVIIKMLSDDADRNQQEQFLKEILPYRDIEDTHLVKVLGLCLDMQPFLILLEYFPFGDLKNYMLNHVNDLNSFNGRGLIPRFACDMAAGLNCLHQRGFVHPDFAIRNCQVSAELTIKIGDYGISPDIYKNDYYFLSEDSAGVPIRWLPIECIKSFGAGNIDEVNITMSTNIWSFGIALWELIEFGKQPYCTLSNEEVLGRLKQRQLFLGPPRTAVSHSDKMYEVMQQCWTDADDRPSISSIHATLRHLMTNVSDMEQEEFAAKWNQLMPKKAPEAVQVPLTNLRTQSFETDFISLPPTFVRMPPDGMSEKDENSPGSISKRGHDDPLGHETPQTSPGPTTGRRSSHEKRNSIVMGTRISSRSSISYDSDQGSPLSTSFDSADRDNQMQTSTPVKLRKLDKKADLMQTITPVKAKKEATFEDYTTSTISSSVYVTPEVEYDTRRSSSTAYNTLDFFTPRTSLMEPTLSPTDELEEMQTPVSQHNSTDPIAFLDNYPSPQTSIDAVTFIDSYPTPDQSVDHSQPWITAENSTPTDASQTFSALLDTIRPPSYTPPTTPRSGTPTAAASSDTLSETSSSADLVILRTSTDVVENAEKSVSTKSSLKGRRAITVENGNIQNQNKEIPGFQKHSKESNNFFDAAVSTKDNNTESDVSIRNEESAKSLEQVLDSQAVTTDNSAEVINNNYNAKEKYKEQDVFNKEQETDSEDSDTDAKIVQKISSRTKKNSVELSRMIFDRRNCSRAVDSNNLQVVPDEDDDNKSEALEK